MITLTFQVTDKKARELNRLQVELNLSSKLELFNNAHTLMQWAVEQVKNGRQIASKDPRTGEVRELVMPVFRR